MLITGMCPLPTPQVASFSDPEQVTSPPVDGIFVHGLYIDGARWDTKGGCLVESEPGEMVAPLPVVHFQPLKESGPAAEKQYECPLYKTSVRAGVLSTTGQSTNFVLCVSLPIRAGTDSDYWVLQGVALLCMLDT
jgi:dynein heavy chain